MKRDRNFKYFGIALLLVVCTLIRADSNNDSEDLEKEDAEEQNQDVSFVTCGSVIKLRHNPTGFRLHSHQVQYGTGSGQQSVTGFPNLDDNNSFWVIKGQIGKQCKTGTPLVDGDQIRLQHLATGKLLHSHLHKSPLTSQQEVSAFGDNGSGDTGDHWKIVLPSTTSSHWKRGEVVKLAHVDTNKFLSSNKNKFPNPIAGQQEVACIADKNSKDTEWVAEEGFYFPKISEK